MLLHSDDAALYKNHLAAYAKEYQPAGLREQELAQGRAENQDYYVQHAVAGANLIELGTFLKYKNQFKNLQLEESRLQRRYEKEMAELRSLQKARKAVEKLQKPQAKPATTAATNETGFVFSTVQNQSNAFSATPAITPSEGGFQPAQGL